MWFDPGDFRYIPDAIKQLVRKSAVHMRLSMGPTATSGTPSPIHAAWAMIILQFTAYRKEEDDLLLTPLCSPSIIHQVSEDLAGLERHDLPRGNNDLFAGFRVPPDAFLLRAYKKAPEADDLYSLPLL
jgi:hypothetical protein